MNNGVKRLLIILLFLIIGIAIGAGMIWKANNPNDYRHPRDRDVKLY